MKRFNILPTPVYLESSGIEVPIPRVRRTGSIDEVLTAAEKDRFRSHITHNLFASEGYVLRVTQDGVVIYAQSPAGTYHGENTLSKLMTATGGRLLESLVLDYPAFQIRATAEKFYGDPWTWPARMDVIKAISKVGYNAYLFSPPDFYLIANWASPFPVYIQEQLAKLITHAHKHHVIFVYGMSPVGIDFGSREDFQKLLKKCRELIELGTDGIVLTFDDISIFSREKAALRQANLLNNLFQQIGNDLKFLAMVPVEYYGLRTTSYLRTIGKELDPEIIVAWTGPKMRSDKVTSEEVLKYSEIIGRVPFLGHNFPVADESSKVRLLTISPLTGLYKELANILPGISFSFMELPYSSLISGSTAGDFAWNPAAYSPEDSISKITAMLLPSLAKLAEINPESLTQPDAVSSIARVLGQRRLRDLDPETILQLQDIFDYMVNLEYLMLRDIKNGTHAELVLSGLDEKIYREIHPWLNQANKIGTLGNLVLNGKINRMSRFARGLSAVKMIGGPRLGGRVFEDFVVSELGFPASILKYTTMRWFFDVVDTVWRGRHRKQRYDL